MTKTKVVHKHIVLTQEQANKLVRRSREQGRSMNAHVAYLIERDDEIPVIGKVKADGTIEMNDPYRGTDKGIDQ